MGLQHAGLNEQGQTACPPSKSGLGARALLAWAMVAGACSPQETEGSGFSYCDAQVVFEDKCVRCHGPQMDMSTPFSLTSYSEVVERSDAIERVVSLKSMPPTIVDLDPPVEPLTEAEEQLLLDWLADGAPAGDCL